MKLVCRVLPTLGKSLKYQSWEMHLRAFRRCWGLCSLYSSFSVLSGPAATELPPAYQGDMLTQASEDKMISTFEGTEL